MSADQSGEHEPPRYGYEDDVYGSCSCGETRPHNHLHADGGPHNHHRTDGGPEPTGARHDEMYPDCPTQFGRSAES